MDAPSPAPRAGASGGAKASLTVLIVAPFCSIRPYAALALGLVERNFKVGLAASVEVEASITALTKGRVGFYPLLGSLNAHLHAPSSLKALERGHSAALIDLTAQLVASSAATNYRLVWEAAAGSLADMILITGPHSVHESLAVGQKLNIPVAVAASHPVDAAYETSGGHHLLASWRAVEWLAVSGHLNDFRASLGLRSQDQDETAFLPFLGAYSPLYSRVPTPPPPAPHHVSGFWRTAPEPFSSSPELDAFLAGAGAGDPPVFVTLGDTPLPNPGAPFQAIAAALTRLNLRGLFAAPEGVTLPPFGSNVFVVSNKMPLEWAVARCSIAIHHGGPTSLTASLSAGLPTIVLPLAPEAFYAAQRLAILGVGPAATVALQEVDEAAVVRVLQEAAQPKVKELSRQIGAQMQAEDGLPATVAWIGTFINTHKWDKRIRMEWQPDEEAHDCTLCHAGWSLFNRRHHCRSCGAVCCAQCLTLTALLNHRFPQLVCKACVAVRKKNKPETKQEVKSPVAAPASVVVEVKAEPKPAAVVVVAAGVGGVAAPAATVAAPVSPASPASPAPIADVKVAPVTPTDATPEAPKQETAE